MVVDITIHSALKKIMELAPRDDLTFLRTGFGKSFTAAGFGNWFRDCCGEVEGLPAHCRAHGLRKAAARRLGEASCTDHEIMSITGHNSIAEVQRYTRAASRQKMVISATKKDRTGNADAQT